MQILWMCNVPLPRIGKVININTPFGGWLDGLSNEIIKMNEVKLAICFPAHNSSYYSGTVDNIDYYSFRYDEPDNSHFISIIEQVKPDIIHIFGTEFKHSMYMMDASITSGLAENTIVSIQGLISKVAYHYYSDLPMSVLFKESIHDLIRMTNVYQMKKHYKRMGEYEKKVLLNAKHITGRTEWDRACVFQNNKNAKYYFCNEILRKSFYEYEWDIDKCEPFSIFISQVGYPIKGFHMMIEAMAEIIKDYPNAHIYATGKDLFSGNINDIVRRTGYEKYLLELIMKYKLRDNITFLGRLNETEMCKQYLRSNVFVLCSSIENSPNSLGEAMLLGVPCVASDVGGVSDFIDNKAEGFVYPYNEPYMLAHYIERVFSEHDNTIQLSRKARTRAVKIFDRKANSERMMAIYKSIMQN